MLGTHDFACLWARVLVGAFGRTFSTGVLLRHDSILCFYFSSHVSLGFGCVLNLGFVTFCPHAFFQIVLMGASVRRLYCHLVLRAVWTASGRKISLFFHLSLYLATLEQILFCVLLQSITALVCAYTYVDSCLYIYIYVCVYIICIYDTSCSFFHSAAASVALDEPGSGYWSVDWHFARFAVESS